MLQEEAPRDLIGSVVSRQHQHGRQGSRRVGNDGQAGHSVLGAWRGRGSRRFLQEGSFTTGPLEGTLRFFLTNFTFGHVFIQCSLNTDDPTFSKPSRDCWNFRTNRRCVRGRRHPGLGLLSAEVRRRLSDLNTEAPQEDPNLTPTLDLKMDASRTQTTNVRCQHPVDF